MTSKQKSELAWAAGMLDGEGTIQVKHRVQNGYTNLMLHVSISNAHRPTIERLRDILGGGYVHTVIAGSGRPLHRVEWAARKSAKVLTALAPHVFTKREQVDAALEFRKMIRYQGAYGRKKMPPEQRAAMEQLANSVNTLRMHKAIPSQATEAVKEAKDVEGVTVVRESRKGRYDLSRLASGG